jgi:hypothetical protein
MNNNNNTPDSDVEIYNHENRYLMRSSLFFLIPGVHALFRQKYTLSSILLIGPFVSYKYWSRPRNDVWRTADMICANMGMGLFIGNAAWNIQVPIYKYMISSFYGIGGISYIYGSYEHEQRNKNWFIYHLMMHTMMWLGHAMSICVS